jgi:Stage II sporulation protein E (SpoIIE)
VLQIEIAVAKVPKYAVLESGDSVEVVERPRGGISVIIADGQRSGRSAKAISNMAVRKAVGLVAEGVRDGAVARAAHDYLRTQRGGQVSAELTIISVDLETRTLVVSRNSRCPVLLSGGTVAESGVSGNDTADGGIWRVLSDSSEPVGVQARARPIIVELPLSPGQTVIAFTDGLMHAGSRWGRSLDPIQIVSGIGCPSNCPASEVAEELLRAALVLDESRPADDVAVVVVQIVDVADTGGPDIRRMNVSFPVP